MVIALLDMGLADMNYHSKLSVSDWIASKGIRLRDLRDGDHKTICPECSHTRRNKSEPCLSVTIRQGVDVVVNCHHCGWADGNATARQESNRSYRPRSYNKPTPPTVAEQPDTMLAWFAKRGISEKTVKAVGVYKTDQWFPQTKETQPCIAFPYFWKGELRNVKYRSQDKQFRQEKNPEPVLFNADSIQPDADLFFCEGEIDVLSFIEAGYMNAVSLANGAPKEVEKSEKRYEPLATHAEELEKVRRIFIATDTDGPGESLANELARRLGRDRCFRVRFDVTDGVCLKDGNEVLQQFGKEGLSECVDSAAPWPIDGIFSVSDFDQAVNDLYDGVGPKPLSTGFDEFDKAFKPMPGQFVVVTGIPNHGKSRFVDQIAVQMSKAHGWVWGVFSPETGEDQHIADLCEIESGMPFFQGPNPRMSREELRHSKFWVDSYFKFISSKEHTPDVDWILERARALVLRHGMNGLIVDPYNEIEASRPANQTETEFVSQLISKFKRFAKLNGVTVFMVVHPTKLRSQNPGEKEPVPGLYDLAGSAHWRNKADAGLVVYRDYGEQETHVFSKKIRRQPICGVPGMVRFTFVGTDRRFHEQAQSFSNLGAST